MAGRVFVRSPVRGGRPSVRDRGKTTHGAGALSVTVEVDEMDVARRKLVSTVVPLIVGKILQRTQAGLDAEGDKFKPYSQGHARARQKKGLQASTVDLRVTGQMLGSLGLKKTKISVDGVSLTIGPAANQMAKAKAIEEYGREFVGLTQGELQAIATQLESLGIAVTITER